MIYPEADKIDKQVESKYALVILAAKRAKQLKEGDRPLIGTDSTNPLTIALEEIAKGEIRPQFDADSLAGREALADKEAVVGRRDLEVPNADPLAVPSDLLARAASQLGAGLDDTLGLDDEDIAEDEVEEEEDAPLLNLEDEAEGTE